MPKLLHARPPVDADEERQIRRLAGARHAPTDWIMRAQIIAFSWQGLRTSAIAAKLGCHMQTVHERIERSGDVARPGARGGPCRHGRAAGDGDPARRALTERPRRSSVGNRL
ncbi:helix-turn-helix domain-containing protein [Sphaerisporangium sp. NBC_01403]|uniref:helix-turn-helix domain-containing protein n=1 Tax=Sphaerisporangium sp. NBC_01403 TaxID=2903599 RepID=UPI00325692D4